MLQDGHIVRLKSIKAASDEATDILESVVLNRVLILQDTAEDRYGQRTATASVQGEERSIEDSLLSEGLAFVYPTSNDERLDAYCGTEREARLSKRGFGAAWRDASPEEAVKFNGKIRLRDRDCLKGRTHKK